MPTYEYACRSCGSHLEVVQAFSDEPLTECLACAGPLRKVFGSIGISFKGSGFYKTDSRSSAKAGSEARRDKDRGTDGTGGDRSEKSDRTTKAEKPAAGDKSGSGAGSDSGSSSGSGGTGKGKAKESTAAKSA
jgi:putative FmdB family regulatory protein